MARLKQYKYPRIENPDKMTAENIREMVAKHNKVVLQPNGKLLGTVTCSNYDSRSINNGKPFKKYHLRVGKTPGK